MAVFGRISRIAVLLSTAVASAPVPEDKWDFTPDSPERSGRAPVRHRIGVGFAPFCEEKSVTKASARLLLSQPAVSRALQRARSMLQDELVIRSSSGFELTLRGRKILQELEQLLPKVEGLVVPGVFDPKKERSSFRVSGPDNVCMALLPHLCRRY